MSMISSGRTRSVRLELEGYYRNQWQDEKDTEWVWGFGKEMIQNMLNVRKPVPFGRYMVRYLLTAFEKELHPHIFPETSMEEGWLDKAADDILKGLQQEPLKYKSASKSVRAVADLVAEASDGQIWKMQAVLNCLKADITSVANLYKFAFSANMAYEDVDFFLTKVFRRTKLNLWIPDEFLHYLTFRYAKGDCFAFYGKLAEEYKNCRPQTYIPAEKREGATVVVTNFLQDFVNGIQQSEEMAETTFRLNDQGELSEDLKTLLAQHKYLCGHEGSYEHTVTAVSRELLEEFIKTLNHEQEQLKKALREDLENIKKDVQKLLKDNETIIPGYTKEEMQYFCDMLVPRGSVRIQYDPQKGLKIPAKTEFYSKDGAVFVSEDDIHIEPEEEKVLDVEIPVRCTLHEKRTGTPEEQKGFVQKHTEFQWLPDGTAAGDSVYELSNGSKFKTLIVLDSDGKVKKEKNPEAGYLSGTIQGKCICGTELKKGSVFCTVVKKGETPVKYVSTEDVDTNAYAEVKVYGMVPGTEARTGEIVSCSLSKWEEKFITMKNSYIKARTRERETKGGALFNYLYYSDPAEYSLTRDILDSEYYDLLADVLKGTQLGGSKLNNIQNGVKDTITRENLITLCFLDYASRIDRLRVDYELGLCDEDLSMERIQAGFLQKTNAVLNACGYYELYVMNPYDALLICMLASNESINAFKNIWTWYLTQTAMKKMAEENHD